MKTGQTKTSPVWWVPSLYFAEGLPYVIVMSVSVIMYKNFNLSNSEIAFYTGWLYLPWVIKPLWSPIVDLFKTKRWWIVTMQTLIGASFASIAFSLHLPYMVELSLALFWLMAFASSTHDIAADGFYLLAVPDKDEQAFYVGIRSTFYRISTIVGSGVLVALAGVLIDNNMAVAKAWSLTFVIMAIFFFALFLYHRFVLPRPDSDHATGKNDSIGAVVTNFGKTFVTFFRKPYVISSLLFMLLYRLPEALLVKMTGPFLLDAPADGGMGLTNVQVGVATGTVGVIGLTIGGILGGVCASRGGLKRWLWPMVAAISLPNIVYIIMAMLHPSFTIINVLIFIEQFGYGFGFTAYMLFLIHYAEGENTTAHYAICTAFMAMGMMIPGMAAGWLQEQVGYNNFFIIICALCLVTVVVSYFVKLDKPQTSQHEKD